MQRNRVGNLALLLSSSGLVSLFVFNNDLLGWLMPWSVLSCPIGLLLGVIAMYRPPRRSAVWAVAIGVLGSLYIPTIWLFYLRAA
jgi:hypothetical protein